MKILLAEDEEHIAKLILFKLKKEGFDVTWAKEGQEALSLALGAEWDSIILDVMMPFMDGWEVLRNVREKSKSVPVLMLSAKSAEKDLETSKGLGASGFLRKPFDPSELVRVLKELAS